VVASGTELSSPCCYCSRTSAGSVFGSVRHVSRHSSRQGVASTVAVRNVKRRITKSIGRRRCASSAGAD